MRTSTFAPKELQRMAVSAIKVKAKSMQLRARFIGWELQVKQDTLGRLYVSVVVKGALHGGGIFTTRIAI